MKMKNWMILFLNLFLCLAIVGCMTGEDDADNNDNGGNDNNVCDPGASRACGCPDGRNGSQTCADDGERFNSCVCTGPMPGSGGSSSGGCGSDSDCSTGRICSNGTCVNQPPPGSGGTSSTGGTSGGGGECVPGRQAGCHCGDGRSGGKTCGSNGFYGPCVCSGDTGTGSGGTSSTIPGGNDSGSARCGSAGVNSVRIQATSWVEHIYCYGAEVAKNDHREDRAPGLFFQEWQSFNNDSFDGSYDVTVEYCADRSLRFQCYLKDDGNPADALRYTCAVSNGLQSGETFHVSRSFVLVDNLDEAKNCQVD